MTQAETPRERETVWCEAHDGPHFDRADCVHPHYTDQETRAAMNAAATELPGGTPGRAARIAALRMAADWIELHGAPGPSDVKILHEVHVADEPDGATRLAMLLGFAEKNPGGRFFEYDGGAFYDVRLADPSAHGARVTYTYWIEKAPGAGKVLP